MREEERKRGRKEEERVSRGEKIRREMEKVFVAHT